MLELSSKDVARGFSDVVNRVHYAGERVVLTRRGRPLAALVSIADLELLQKQAGAATPDTQVQSGGTP